MAEASHQCQQEDAERILSAHFFFCLKMSRDLQVSKRLKLSLFALDL
jgi:hypothetical protein